MKSAKKVITKKPSNASTNGAADKPKPKKPRAKVLGQDLRKLKKMNPSADQSMRRPGLVTTKGPG